jgi:uncharacterized protein (DUF1810 family)
VSDDYDLERFVAAQDVRATYQSAVAQLRAGRKTGHWMWFVFPQVAGLGRSPMARRYEISSLAEARAYLEHPVLGARIAECARILTGIPGSSAEAVFGGIDAVKLRSSMTLFARAAADPAPFTAVLDRYFDGVPDPLTAARL